jgi:hypothetical protein
MSASRVAVAVVALLATAAPLRAQDDPLGARLERVTGMTEAAVETFFGALRRNVGQNNRRDVCEMVAYPLGQPDGPVANAAACEARYDAIFTIAVRKAVGKQQFEDLFANQNGVMVGVGELWFARVCRDAPCAQSDLRVTAVNGQSAAGLIPPQGKVLLACIVSGQRVRVSADGRGGASLSVWLSPRFNGPPEREFPKAESIVEASECSSRTWTFADGTRTYTVSELPCDAYLSPPPMGSVGRVTLSTAASPGSALWCRE